MEFDIYNPSTWHLIKDDTVFYINGRDVYHIDFSSRIQIKDFLRLLQHNICLAEQKKKDFTESDRHQLITSILLSYYKNNTKEGVLEFYEKYDLYNVNDWEDFPDCPLVYKGEILIAPETGEAIKASDFARFLTGLQNFLQKQDKNAKLGKQNIDTLLQRMLDSQHENSKKEEFILNQENEDKDESGFNPLDESTWNLASEKRIMRINGVRLIKDEVFMSEKDFLYDIKLNIKFNINKKTTEEIVKDNLNLSYSLYAEKDLEPVYTINGFSFSKALCDTCYDTEKERLEKIADAMNYCISQNLKKYQYKQYFFDNFIPADKEFFVEVYFAEKYSTRKDVDDLIVAFYSEFEPNLKEEIEEIIKSSRYLTTHKELVPIVRKILITNINC